MSYRIKYCYDTGDSENNYPNEEAYICIVHENLEAAKRNVQRINEHYSLYQAINGNITLDQRQALILDKSIEDWFVASSRDSLILYTDKGKRLQLHADWCGYFENLNWVAIEDDSTNLIIT